jgi:hypothetical protein
LISFLTLYYVIGYREKHKFLYLFFYLALLSFAIFVLRGRANILILLFVSSIVFLKNISFGKFFKLLVPFGMGVVFVVLLGDILFNKYISDLFFRMSQAFTVLGGTMTSDPSADSRIIQSGIIIDFLSKNISSIWFGVGQLSNQFMGFGETGGYNAIFGYLYPTDTGLIGALFTWGIIGLIFVYLIPVIFIIKEIRNIRKIKNIFIITLNYFLIFILITSLYTGNIVFDPAFIFFVMGIKIAYNKKYRKEIVEQ